MGVSVNHHLASSPVHTKDSYISSLDAFKNDRFMDGKFWDCHGNPFAIFSSVGEFPAAGRARLGG